MRRFGLVRLVGRKTFVDSFNVVFSPILVPNFIQIKQKTQELKICTIGRLWLVGEMVVGIFILSCFILNCFGPLLVLAPNFILIGRKTQVFANGRFWLVGLVGRKMVAATSNIRNLLRGLPMTSVQNWNLSLRFGKNLEHQLQ